MLLPELHNEKMLKKIASLQKAYSIALNYNDGYEYVFVPMNKDSEFYRCNNSYAALEFIRESSADYHSLYKRYTDNPVFLKHFLGKKWFKDLATRK
jgi:hypothetical protein